MSIADTHRMRDPGFRGRPWTAKAVLDRVGATVLLVLALPGLLLIALVLVLESPGPVLVRHRRLGQGGRPFDLLRFRSTAARLPADAVASAADQGDPAVTRVGRVLRRYGLDRLPQLLNVVKGDMSLVGPRPAAAHDCCEHGAGVCRLVLRPGLIGVQPGRPHAEQTEAAVLDRYLRNWSVARDLAILWRSVRAVLRDPDVR